MKVSFAASLLLPLALSGCVIPYPHKRQQTFGVEGRVVDARTRKPIEGATVQADYRKSHKTVQTDAQGKFAIGSVERWHYGILFSPPLSHSIFPLGECVPQRCRSLAVSAPGYVPYKTNSKDWWEKQKSDKPPKEILLKKRP